jgi:hypothetical protein
MSTIYNPYNDTPLGITSDKSVTDYDTLKTNDFARQLAAFIHTSDTPITIGLQGDWGTGKTSMMNLIKWELGKRDGKRIHLVEVNTWHYSMFRQDEYLGIVIINSLVKELARKFATEQGKGSKFSKDLRSAAGKFGGLVRAVVQNASVPGLGGVKFSEVMEGVKSDDDLDIENLAHVLQEFKKEFTILIKENLKDDERLVFFVDDLDRIRPGKAVEILETLKNFMEVDQCVFVLAIDYEIVQLGIAEKFGSNVQKTSGKSFFDKIIQVPFMMPTVSYDLGAYLKGLLEKKSLILAKTKDLTRYVQFTETTIGRNPRSIKRAVNYTYLLTKIRDTTRKEREKSTGNTKENEDERKTNRDRELLYAIVCLQIEWPELFAFFVSDPSSKMLEKMEDWDYLDALPQARKIFLRSSDPEQIKQNISGYFDLLFELLDDGNDGIISNKEMEPLHNLLDLARLTTVAQIEKNQDPSIAFWDLVNINNNSKIYHPSYDFIRKSLWGKSESLSLKKSGERYVTLVMNRRQVGSWVTLKSDPFIFRLKLDQESLISALLKHYTDSDTDWLRTCIRSYDRTQKTGIGQSEIFITGLKDEKKMIEFLNNLFRVVQLETKS